MKAIKVLLISIGALLAALIVVPLTILAGLFVWLKLTEETDDEEMELDDTI
jgi:nitric oxide reductase large subunit